MSVCMCVCVCACTCVSLCKRCHGMLRLGRGLWEERLTQGRKTLTSLPLSAVDLMRNGQRGKARQKRREESFINVRWRYSWWWWWCRREWGWEDVFHVVWVCVWCKGTLTEAGQSKYGYMISTPSFLTPPPPPPPSFFYHSSVLLLIGVTHLQTFRMAVILFYFFICAYLEHFSSKHIPFLLIFFYFLLLTSMLILTEWCEMKMYFPALPTASLFLSLGD